MYIRSVDPAGDAADLAAVLPAIRAAHAGFVPGEPLPGGHRVSMWSGNVYQNTKVNFAAFADASEADALGVIMGNHAEQDPFLGCWAFISPDVAGPEVDAALLQSMFEYCCEHGIGRVVVNTAANADDSRYAPQRAGTAGFVGIRAGLDLTAVDREALAVQAEATAANADYEIVQWVDTCPDELAEAYCVARAAMNDAPTIAEGAAQQAHDLKRMRREEESSIRYGARRLVTAAVAPGGAIGGFNMTATYPDEPEFAEIWDTGVARDHRGRGLGVRLKAAATLRLLSERPQARGLYTFTAASNAPMRAVNRKLGYQDAATWTVFEHEVS